MATVITETAISAAVKRANGGKCRVELTDKELPGLRLRVMPAGKKNPKGGKAWSLMTRDHEGRLRRYPLGTHPQMGVSAARDAARAMRPGVREADAEKRIDPVAAARRQRAIGRDAREGVGTLAALIDLYERKKGIHLKSWPECRRRIESVFATLLKRPITTMKLSALQLAADSWPSGQSAAAAVRYIRPMLKWASEAGRAYCGRDLADISPPDTVRRRDRVLSREELSRLLPVLVASESPYGQAMRLMLLTAVRREEAAGARWQDVDFDAATLTLPETKNGKTHVIPLSRQAVAMLTAIKPKDAKPADLVFQARGGGRLANWGKAGDSIQAKSKTTGWTRHDLRRTAATLMGEAGELPHVIEAALNHTAVHSQLAATYNQARYRPEVAAALQRLADHLDGIAAGGAVVVNLAGRGGRKTAA
jgi:integrase